jgi:hypothetical protein
VSGDSYFGTAPNSSYVSPEGIAQRAVTEVDVESLESATGWLDGLKSYIETHLVPDTNKMTITQGDSELWFGGLDSATKVSMLHTSYVDTVLKSYRTMAQSLDAASRATAYIVKNYRDVEHNTVLTAKNIDTAFANATNGDGSTAADAGQSSDPVGGAPTGGSW